MPDNDRTKTKDKIKSPFDDLTMPRDEVPGNLAPGSRAPTIAPTPEPTPDLGRASAGQTRAATANVGHTDQMRDLMNRMRDVGDDDISDAEAARRAGVAPAGTPTPTPGIRPVEPENLPAVINQLPTTVKQDLETISQEIKARDGKVYPKWHEIKHLPGYMQRAIRAMGRGMFKMFTNTDLEDIITIANVGGQGPNSNLEMQAVAAWLQTNAEDLGASDIDFSQVMPGYNPEVKEYRTATTRFHVVRDPFGVYIYAYPEQDAVEYSSQPAIGSDDVERDEYGAVIKKRLKENTMTNDSNKVKKLTEWIQELGMPTAKEPILQPMIKFRPMTEAAKIKWHKALLEDVEANAELDSYADKILNEFIEETEELTEASTTIQLLKDVPGGPQMAKYLHAHDKIAASAEWDAISSGARVQLKLFKASPDYHMLIIGKNGIASAKPNLADFTAKAERHGPNWQGDNTLLYDVVGWSGDQRVDNMLIPDEYEYEVDKNGEETDKIKKQDVWDEKKQRYVKRPVVVVDNSHLRRRGVLNPNAAPTVITMKRGGTPFKMETTGDPTFFDMLKGAIGNIEKVYIATSKIGGRSRKGDVQRWIQDYKAGRIPTPAMGTVATSASLPNWPADRTSDEGKKKIGKSYIVQDTNTLWAWDGEEWNNTGKVPEVTGPVQSGTGFGSGQRTDDISYRPAVYKRGAQPRRREFGEPTAIPATREKGATARELIAKREKAKTEFKPGQFVKQPNDTPQGVAMALRPVIDKFMHKKFAELKDRIARYTAAENDEAAGKAVALRKNIREIMTALDTSNPDWNSAPLRKLTAIVDQSVSNIAGQGEDKKEVMNQISQLRAPVVQQWWDDFKRQLDKTDVFSRYFY